MIRSDYEPLSADIDDSLWSEPVSSQIRVHTAKISDSTVISVTNSRAQTDIVPDDHTISMPVSYESAKSDLDATFQNETESEPEDSTTVGAIANTSFEWPRKRSPTDNSTYSRNNISDNRNPYQYTANNSYAKQYRTSMVKHQTNDEIFNRTTALDRNTHSIAIISDPFATGSGHPCLVDKMSDRRVNCSSHNNDGDQPCSDIERTATRGRTGRFSNASDQFLFAGLQ